MCGLLTCIQADLANGSLRLPKCDLIIANLLVEYIGCDCFRRVVSRVRPQYVSCAIQIDSDEAFVSESPYLHVFDCLDKIHCSVDGDVLTQKMAEIGYRSIGKGEFPLPNGKKLLRMDFRREAMNGMDVK